MTFKLNNSGWLCDICVRICAWADNHYKIFSWLINCLLVVIIPLVVAALMENLLKKQPNTSSARSSNSASWSITKTFSFNPPQMNLTFHCCGSWFITPEMAYIGKTNSSTDVHILDMEDWSAEKPFLDCKLQNTVYFMKEHVDEIRRSLLHRYMCMAEMNSVNQHRLTQPNLPHLIISWPGDLPVTMSYQHPKSVKAEKPRHPGSLSQKHLLEFQLPNWFSGSVCSLMILIHQP